MIGTGDGVTAEQDQRLGETRVDEVKRSLDTPLALASLVGERVLVLHEPGRGEAELGLGGHDVDCAVDRIDPMWPLRLSDGWSLCNSIHYDLKGWYWVIERDGNVIALDTIDDPLGLGRDSFRTHLLIGEKSAHASPFVRAAYLTAKRLRKEIHTPGEWSRIGRLAREDPHAFRGVLDTIVGRRLAQLVADAALEGRPPNPMVFDVARRLLRVRRFGSPARLTHAVILGARRYAERLLHPTGFSVLIAGPDGSGKSTLAEALPAACVGVFKRHAAFHWRPGLLPRAGALLGKDPADASTPHGTVARSRGVSLALLGYYWLDFCLGNLIRVFIVRVRAGIAIIERGWWDMSVDPARYRLDVPNAIVRAVGGLTPRQDLALILESSPDVLLARKEEISAEELARQVMSWRHTLPEGIPRLHLDAANPVDQVLQAARGRILQLMEARTVARLGAGWATLPKSGSPRWWIPRGPTRTVRRALAIHHPMTRPGLIAWGAATLFAAAGGFAVLPRGSAPPREVRRKLAPHLPFRSTFAVARANHPGRYTALVVDDRGTSHGVAKVATDRAGEEALEREAAAIRRFGPLLLPPLSAPRILAEGQGLLFLAPVSWRPRQRPWVLDADLARAIGALFRTGVIEGPVGLHGPAHGDFAPWNLLQTPNDAILVDWESAAADLPAFHDVCHWLIQAHALLGHPSSEELLRGLEHGEGWMGAAIRGYAEGAGLDPTDVTAGMISYLQIERPKPRTSRERAAVSARMRLLGALGG